MYCIVLYCTVIEKGGPHNYKKLRGTMVLYLLLIIKILLYMRIKQNVFFSYYETISNLMESSLN